MDRSAQWLGYLIMAQQIEHQRPERFDIVTLDWPLKVDGDDVRAIHLHRLTGGEVATLQEAMLGETSSETELIAAFCDQSAAVIAQLDADDFLRLKDRVADFLPQRIRKAMEVAMAAGATAPSEDQPQS